MKRFFLIAVGLMIGATSVSLWMTKDGMINRLGELSPSAGTAAIGGAFSLTDQNGREVKDTDFRGRVMLVFFGFTHCPDICPVTTKNLSNLMEQLGAKADQVAPIFISVDPERDTPAVMKDYMANFDSRMVALTGSREQVEKAVSAYKVFAAKVEPKAEDSHDADHHGGHHDAMDYQVNHSGYIYLMDQHGQYVTHFQYDAKPEDMAKILQPLLK
jgi:protein SCO1